MKWLLLNSIIYCASNYPVTGEVSSWSLDCLENASDVFFTSKQDQINFLKEAIVINKKRTRRNIQFRPQLDKAYEALDLLLDSFSSNVQK